MPRLAALLMVLALPGSASAHALELALSASFGRVTVVAGYDTGEPAEGARVTVTDGAGEVVAEGETDERGSWTTGELPPGTYAVRVDEAQGHRAEGSITVGADSSEDVQRVRAGLDAPRAVRLGLGLGAIAALTAVTWLVRRGRGPRQGARAA